MIIPLRTRALRAQLPTTQRHLLLLSHRLRSHQLLARSTTTTTQNPPTRARRLLRTLTLHTTLSITSLLLGIYLGFTQLPNQSALLALFTSTPISDAASLTTTDDLDPHLAALSHALSTSPTAQSLRANPAFTESRPAAKLPPPLRPANMTAGVLSGPGRIAVPPLVFSEAGGKSLTALFYLGAELCGHPGIVHGGLLATLLDEGLARCCFPALPNRMGVTASLSVDYRKPAGAERFYVLKAETSRVEGRKAWVRGRIEMLEGVEGEEGGVRLVETGVVVAEAEALFVEPRNAALVRRAYPVVAGQT